LARARAPATRTLVYDYRTVHCSCGITRAGAGITRKLPAVFCRLRRWWKVLRRSKGTGAPRPRPTSLFHFAQPPDSSARSKSRCTGPQCGTAARPTLPVAGSVAAARTILTSSSSSPRPSSGWRANLLQQPVC